MNALAPLLEELAEIGEATSQPFPRENSQVSAKDRWLAAMADVGARARRLQENTEKLRSGFRSLEEALLIDPGSVDLDEVVDMLLATEKRVKSNLQQSVARLKSTRAGTFQLHSASPGERSRVIATVDHYDKAFNEVLRFLRDARWRVMALRARNEDPGDAPVFSDPEELIQFLNTK
jgi:hypothetical protein